MPRIPQAPVTTAPIQFTPGRSIGAGIAQAVGGVLQQATGVIQDFQSREFEAKRKHLVATGEAEIVQELTGLQNDAQNDPNFTGSTDRFDEGANGIVDRVAEQFDSETASILALRGGKIFQAMRLDVADSERRRFSAAAKSTMVTLNENYAQAVSLASNPEVEAQLRQAQREAVLESDFLTFEQKADLNQQFDTSVSTSKAIRMLAINPDALVDMIEDPSEFPGISPESRARFVTRALSQSDTAARSADTAAQRDLKQQEDDNTRDIIADFVGGRDPEEIQADFLSRSEDFSASQAGVIASMLKAARVRTDDEQTFVDLEESIDAGEVNADQKVDAAYIGGQLTLGSRNRLIARDDLKNEPKASGRRLAYDDIKAGLGPTPYDDPGMRQVAVLRMRAGRQELDIFLQNNSPTQPELQSKVEQILRAFPGGESIQPGGAFRSPWGIRKGTFDVTPEDLDISDAKLGEDLLSGKISADMAIFQDRNNRSLDQVAKENVVRLKKEALKRANE